MTEEHLKTQHEDGKQPSRRSFLRGAVSCVCGAIAVAAVGSLVTSCETDEKAPAGPKEPVKVDISKEVRLATVGATVLVNIPELDALPTFIHRVSETSFNAFVSKCTHQQAPIREPEDVDAPCICSNHSASFSRVDGAVESQPIGGGTATNLRTYQTSFDASTNILTITA